MWNSYFIKLCFAPKPIGYIIQIFVPSLVQTPSVGTCLFYLGVFWQFFPWFYNNTKLAVIDCSGKGSHWKRDRHLSVSEHTHREPSAAGSNKRYLPKNKNKSTASENNSGTTTTTTNTTTMHRNSTHIDAQVTVVHSSTAMTSSMTSEPTPNDNTPPLLHPRGILTKNNNNSANDYVREMWPMVVPPLSNAATVGPLLYDQESNIRADSDHFQYGDSSAMLTLSAEVAPPPPPPSLSSAAHRRHSSHRSSAPSPMMDSEDDTHIYETPKYLRREKAATMKLRGVIKTTQSQYCPAGPQRVSIAEPPEQDLAPPAARHSQTLPRGGLTGNKRVWRIYNRMSILNRQTLKVLPA